MINMITYNDSRVSVSVFQSNEELFIKLEEVGYNDVREKFAEAKAFYGTQDTWHMHHCPFLLETEGEYVPIFAATEEELYESLDSNEVEV